MKEVYKQKLRKEIVDYCNQIGIKDELYLTFDPKEYIERLKKYYDEEAIDSQLRRIGGRHLGRCHEESKTILLNQNCRGPTWEYDRNDKGKKVKRRINGRTYYTQRKYKLTYRIWRHVLVHELVHYRFPKMDHGDRFERRFREILHGRVFPDMNTLAKVERQATLSEWK